MTIQEIARNILSGGKRKVRGARAAVKDIRSGALSRAAEALKEDIIRSRPLQAVDRTLQNAEYNIRGNVENLKDPNFREYAGDVYGGQITDLLRAKTPATTPDQIQPQVLQNMAAGALGGLTKAGVGAVTKPFSDASLMDKVGAILAGVGAVAAPGMSTRMGLVGSGINQAVNPEQDQANNVSQSMYRAAQMAPLVAATQPGIDRLVGRIGASGNSFVREQVLPRLASSGLNVSQGVGINAATNTPNTKESLVIDALAGLLSKGVDFKAPEPQNFTPLDMKDLQSRYGMQDIARQQKINDENFARVMKNFPKTKQGQIDVRTAQQEGMARAGSDPFARFDEGKQVVPIKTLDTSPKPVAEALDKVKSLEGESLEKAARKHFGTTTDPRMSLFLTKDGKMIDGSGSKLGNKDFRNRIVDHKEINQISDDAPEWNDYMSKTDNIRTGIQDNEANIDIVKMPNEKQLSALERMTKGKVIQADITDPSTSRPVKSGEFKNFSEYKEWISKYFNKSK